MAPLQHANLVRLYGGVWNEGADKLCIVLEWCQHGSLVTFLAEEVGTWKGLRHGLALGAAKGLRYLHHGFKEPLIHRDVKPDNILVGEDIVAKLADFGETTNFDREAARRNSDYHDDALSMTMVGTKLYAAPEVMLMERYNERAASVATRVPHTPVGLL
jgi:serine/threonine protein kinase